MYSQHFFSAFLMNGPNKFECLSPTILSSLERYALAYWPDSKVTKKIKFGKLQFVAMYLQHFFLCNLQMGPISLNVHH
jgi:hypothetical protein